MERFAATRAWGASSLEKRENPRPSWFVDQSTPESPAEWRVKSTETRQNDIAPARGNRADADAAADSLHGTFDERFAFDANTHPEYKKWLQQTAAAHRALQDQEAAIAAADDVVYDMETRAFGVPRAPAPGSGRELRYYSEYDAGAGGHTAPDHAKAFFYMVDARTGLPTDGSSDGWTPTGKAAALDEFVRRTTQFAPLENFPDPSTGELRRSFASDTHVGDDALRVGSARIAAALAAAQSAVPTNTQTKTESKTRHATTSQATSQATTTPRKPPMRLLSQMSKISKPARSARVDASIVATDASNAAAAYEAERNNAKQNMSEALQTFQTVSKGSNGSKEAEAETETEMHEMQLEGLARAIAALQQKCDENPQNLETIDALQALQNEYARLVAPSAPSAPLSFSPSPLPEPTREKTEPPKQMQAQRIQTAQSVQKAQGVSKLVQAQTQTRMQTQMQTQMQTPTSDSGQNSGQDSPLPLLETPFQDVMPCIWNATCGAAYDLSHWSELPTNGSAQTLQFVFSRDGRGEFLLLGFALLLLVILTCVGVGFACTSGKSTASSPSFAAPMFWFPSASGPPASPSSLPSLPS